MAYYWGNESRSVYVTLHPYLQEVFDEVLKTFDCALISGYRDKKTQNDWFDKELSKVQWPNSEHNYFPSRAVDAVPGPWPVDWEATRRFDYFGGLVLGTARGLGIKLRWGGDWDRDGDPTDQRFNDLVHFELWPHSHERPQ